MDSVAHQFGLIPPLALLAVSLYFSVGGEGRRVPLPYAWVATGLFISWIADSVQHYTGGGWWHWYLFLPVQVWVILQAFIKSPTNRLMAGWALIILTSISVAISAPGLDIIVTGFGSIAILFVAQGRLLIPLFIYFFFGSIASIVMAWIPPDVSMVPWYCYQSCRLLASISFIVVTAPPLIQTKGAE